MHDKSYSRGLFLCIPIRERELSVTVELSMPEVQTDHPETAELSKPQLRMVDLNLLTVFDAVMQEQTSPVPLMFWECRNLRSVTLLHA